MAWEYMALACQWYDPDQKAAKAGQTPRWYLEGHTGPLEADLNSLGRAGWELVAIQQATDNTGSFTAEQRVESIYVFKRPLAEPSSA